MNRLPIISAHGRGMDKQQTAQNKQLLIHVVGEQDVPWWEDKPTEPSAKYFIYIIAPEEAGMPDPWGKEKKLFRFVRVVGHQETTIDEGTIEQEKVLVQKQPWQRQIWVKGQKLGDFFFDTPHELNAASDASYIMHKSG